MLMSNSSYVALQSVAFLLIYSNTLDSLRFPFSLEDTPSLLLLQSGNLFSPPASQEPSWNVHHSIPEIPFALFLYWIPHP